MKFSFYFICMIAFSTSVFSQSTGELLFVGFNADGNDGFSVASMVTIPASQTIYFTDDEWSGTTLNTGEGRLTWSTGASAISFGTIITFTNLSSGTLTVTTGTASQSTAINLNASGEVLYAYKGSSSSNPTTFLSAITNDAFNATNGVLTNTGLTSGTNAVAISGNNDVMVYNGSTLCNSGLPSCQAMLTNTTNWAVQEGAGNQDNDGTFPDFPASLISALPSELIKFQVSENLLAIRLTWQTATETNTSHFQIQRSADAENWQTIGEVKAAGESRETKNYSFTDENPLPISYYRLRSVDFDGAEQFSQVERVERQGATKAPYVLPTNVENETTVVFESELERDADVLIFDMMGRQVFSQAVAIQKGENRQPLDLGSLPKGAYTLQVSGNESAPARFVKM